MRSKNSAALTTSEKKHMERLRQLPCSVCDAPGPSYGHHIKQALAGVPGRFYALENGHVLGTAFPATHPISEYQHLAVVTGCKFAAFILQPVAMEV